MNDIAGFSAPKKALLWAAVLSGFLLAMLDQNIVGTALPEVVDDLGDDNWYVWGVTAYLVPATVLLPVFARLSDRYGRQGMLLTGMSLFVLGSALCALAGSMAQLAAFRGVQGAGAAALEALTFTLVAELSGPKRSGAAQAALAAIMAFSFIAGPLVGGLLTDHIGWRWVFLVNVPIGVAAMAAVAAVLPAHLGRSEAGGNPIDFAGIAVLTASVGAILVGLNRHAVVGSWLEAQTGGLVAAGLLGLVLLVRIETTAAAPVIPPRLVRDPVVRRLLLAGATSSFGLYACVLLLPRYYQDIQGFTATRSGVAIYPLLFGLLLAINVGATVIARRGHYVGTLVTGNALMACGAVGFLTFGTDTASWAPFVWMAAIGCGLGPALSGLQLVLGRLVAPTDLGGAMGTLLLGRQVGGALALAVAGAIHSSQLHREASAEAATGAGVGVLVLIGAGLAAAVLLRLRGRANILPAHPAAPPTSPAGASGNRELARISRASA